MAEDPGLRMRCLQSPQQTMQGPLLGSCARVGGLSVLIQPAFIAHAERVLIIALGVRPYQLLMARLIDCAATGHIVVIAGEPEAVAVVAYQRPDAVLLVTPCGTAMHHYQINLTHGRTKLLGW